MARQRYDIGSKWLLQNQGKGALLVGGLKGVRSCEPMPGEVVQNRRLPDGLLQVMLDKDPKTHHVLVEIATFPERRALTQALDDLALAYSTLGHLPELVMLVLRPKGRFRIDGNHAIESGLGLSKLAATWRSVELWTLPAEDFAEAGDVGILPWVPLMQFRERPTHILERCAERIEHEAKPEQRMDLQVVSEVMTQLRFSDPALFELFKGAQAMFESPLVQKWKAEAVHEAIIDLLKVRFGATPRDVTKPLRTIIDEKQLRRLNRVAAKCSDLDAFRNALAS
jgi:hypothetical protein